MTWSSIKEGAIQYSNRIVLTTTQFSLVWGITAFVSPRLWGTIRRMGDEKMERTVTRCEKAPKKRTLLGGLLYAALVSAFSVALIGEFSTAQADICRANCRVGYQKCMKEKPPKPELKKNCRAFACICYKKCHEQDGKGIPPKFKCD